MGEFSQVWTCWNSTTVVEELYEGKNCDGELASAQIIYNASTYTFDCNNDNLCEYAMVREYLATSCTDEGSYEDIPVGINHCSVRPNGTSIKNICTETAIEEYIYDTNDCSGNHKSREILYQNGDCGEEYNNYYKISMCGDFRIDGEQSKGNRNGFAIYIGLLMIIALIMG